jgi:tRNA(fMet)-specific endonuclease VapC
VILDTNAVSALADGSVALEKALGGTDVLSVPVVVLGEFGFGILGSRHRARYEAWLTELMENCRVLPIEVDTARHYAALRLDLKRRGRPVPSNDVWIAALAVEHGLQVVSRDEHFDVITGVHRIGW